MVRQETATPAVLNGYTIVNMIVMSTVLRVLSKRKGERDKSPVKYCSSKLVREDCETARTGYVRLALCESGCDREQVVDFLELHASFGRGVQ